MFNCAPCAGSGAPAPFNQAGSSTVNAAASLQQLQERLEILQGENADLRHELSAFDPAFFEELEDLKLHHHQLTQTCAAQATLIQHLTAQLSQAAAVQ